MSSPQMGEGVVNCGFEQFITPQARAVGDMIQTFWPNRFQLKFEVPLHEIFPQPQNPGLEHIWRFGRADLLALSQKHQSAITLIELHGAHHWQARQARNDRRKYTLARENGVGCLCLYNSVVDRLSRRKMRGLLGGVLFGRRVLQREAIR